MNDLSLSSLLGDKSPRRTTSESSAMFGYDRLTSTIGSEDSRMSFLNRLDVGDLGVRKLLTWLLTQDVAKFVDHLLNNVLTCLFNNYSYFLLIARVVLSCLFNK